MILVVALFILEVGLEITLAVKYNASFQGIEKMNLDMFRYVHEN